MKTPKSAVAVVCGAVMLGVSMPSSLAAAAGPGCEVTSEHAYTQGGADPVSFDRAGNVLLRAWGNEGTGVAKPDGSAVWMHDLSTLGGDWNVGWHTGPMTPDGTVYSGAYHFDRGWRAFVWKGEGLIAIEGGRNAKVHDATASGLLVGTKGVNSPEEAERAVYWASDTSRPKELPTPARFVESRAWFVDRDGTVYGTAERSDSTRVLVRWQDDSMSVVRLPDTFVVGSSFGNTAVSNGQFAGSVATPDGRRVPALFTEDGLWVPPIPDGMSGTASAVTGDGLFGGNLWNEDRTASSVFVGRVSEELTFLPSTTEGAQLAELRAFDGGSALTSDGWITSCLNP